MSGTKVGGLGCTGVDIPGTSDKPNPPLPPSPALHKENRFLFLASLSSRERECRRNISVYIARWSCGVSNGFCCLTSVSQETLGNAGAESPTAAEGCEARYLLVEFLSRSKLCAQT